MRDIRRYEVFRLADGLVLKVYHVTAGFPNEEKFGLTSQMRRAACSIPINLSEGAARASAKEFANFINIAAGSCEEVRYEIHLAARLGYMKAEEQKAMDTEFETVKKVLSRLLAAVAGRRVG